MANRSLLLRSKDVAQVLDCSPDDVLHLVRKGTLRAKKQGKTWQFRSEDVMTYKKLRATG